VKKTGRGRVGQGSSMGMTGAVLFRILAFDGLVQVIDKQGK
jgi:hypothetical protein